MARVARPGAKAGLAAQPRGPTLAPQEPLLAENVRLQQELARVQARLTHAEAVIEIQQKGAQLLGTLPLPTTPGAP
jgi:hypothetical protein